MFSSSFLHSMAMMDEASRIEKEKRKAPEKLEDVINCFLDIESNASKILDISKLSADITMTDAAEESFNNKFKQNKIIPDFDDIGLNFSQNKKPKASPKQNNKLFGKIGSNLANYDVKNTGLHEIGLKDRFSSLKEKFHRPPSNKSSSKMDTQRGESNASQSSINKSLKKSMTKSKSSTQTSRWIFVKLALI